MSTGNDETERLRFRERYRSMSDDDLARLALYEDLIPVAREAITEELEARGLHDLSAFKSRITEEAILAKADGLLAFVPVNARPPVEKDRNTQLLFLTIFAMWALVGVHKWLLGAAITWKSEEALALLIFFALIFTWDPMVRVVKGNASGKLIFWLILGWLYFAVIATPIVVPSVGRMESGLNPLLPLAILAAPAIVLVAHRIARRIASRNR